MEGIPAFSQLISKAQSSQIPAPASVWAEDVPSVSCCSRRAGTVVAPTSLWVWFITRELLVIKHFKYYHLLLHFKYAFCIPPPPLPSPCLFLPFNFLHFSLQYNDYVHFIEPCFKGILVQADRDNREVSTGPLSVELRWLSSCKQSTGLRCCEVKLWGQGTALSEQGLGFRSQQQFSGACWLLGLPQAAAARGQLVG